RVAGAVGLDVARASVRDDPDRRALAACELGVRDVRGRIALPARKAERTVDPEPGGAAEPLPPRRDDQLEVERPRPDLPEIRRRLREHVLCAAAPAAAPAAGAQQG